ncbi:EAL domain-containing protein [Saccharopolyspora sp. NFXS83]|uniref:putative bifunctional diguanylate cyclase/phosphodiesterase n=1 Tax=Saccharopolyspora sp. NFXS83 TaxID=2993560 RepID=UPI00224A50B2|nr:bifunctional diguanylate cyclase/phosphodiesterase [Saccharopolyspora sp. NFXS83]MCX2731790.1 EAL domain-containing protein [Saccharopolyspora sp. NFXS83]
MSGTPNIPDEPFPRTGAQVETERLLGALAADMREYAIFALDTEGRVASWNSGAQLIKQYTSREIIGQHFSIFYPAELVASGYPAWELRQAAANGFFIDRGWRLRKDGTAFWAHVVITAQRADDGRLDGFIKVTRDESEAYAQRERSDRRFTDLFQLAPAGIALLDRHDRVLDANGALCDLLGYRPHDLLAPELMHVDDPRTGLVPHAAPDDDGSEPVSHRRLARSNGEPVFCEVRCAASVDYDGRRFWLAVFQDLTEQQRRTETLHFQATHDQPTGLLNRRGVHELLVPLLSSASEDVGVLFCDLDNFKRFNDSLGHDAGDELINLLAERLVNDLPSSCTPARLYGDEFLIICSDLTACGGLDTLIGLVSDLLCAEIPLRDRLIGVTASIGAATPPEVGTTADELIRTADAAMFAAKEQGHGRTAPPAPVGGLALEEDLRDALLHDGLRMHYQPILARDGTILLAEALVRWPHPTQGLLRPDVILPVASQAKLLGELDRWVLRTALREASRWRCPHGAAPGVTVNLAGLRPDSAHFHAEVSSAIEDSGIEPGRVVLEVVETVLVDLPAQPRKMMRRLNDRGVRFAMDDFGTGYSSLARLKDLPTQLVKLDRRFVVGMESDPTDLGIVRAVIELARGMGRTCIAEGVETQVQADLLNELGVDAQQGFLYSRPVPDAQFRDLLTAPRSMPAE